MTGVENSTRAYRHPHPPQLNKGGLKLVCNINIVHRNNCTQGTIVLYNCTQTKQKSSHLDPAIDDIE